MAVYPEMTYGRARRNFRSLLVGEGADLVTVGFQRKRSWGFVAVGGYAPFASATTQKHQRYICRTTGRAGSFRVRLSTLKVAWSQKNWSISLLPGNRARGPVSPPLMKFPNSRDRFVPQAPTMNPGSCTQPRMDGPTRQAVYEKKRGPKAARVSTLELRQGRFHILQIFPLALVAGFTDPKFHQGGGDAMVNKSNFSWARAGGESSDRPTPLISNRF